MIDPERVLNFDFIFQDYHILKQLGLLETNEIKNSDMRDIIGYIMRKANKGSTLKELSEILLCQ